MTGQRVGVAGDDRLEAIVETAGGTPIRAQSPPADPVQWHVVSGESAIVDLVRAGLDAPVLPVGFDNGFRSVPFEDAETAVARVLEDPESQPTERYPIVAATGPFDPIRILFDIALVAAEPARISEFAVHRGQDRISQFRADGVVASSPAGSSGYNRAAGGPTLEPGTGVAAVVPIAPFATAVGQWVLSIDSIRLSVEREEAPVELLADGRRERTMTTDGSITLSRVDELETYAVPELEEFS